MCPVAWCSADPCASACCKLVVWIVPVGTCYDWFKVQLAKSQLPQSLFCSYQSSSCAKPINTKPWATAAVKAVLKCPNHVDVSDIWVADFNVVEPPQSLTSSLCFFCLFWLEMDQKSKWRPHKMCWVSVRTNAGGNHHAISPHSKSWSKFWVSQWLQDSMLLPCPLRGRLRSIGQWCCGHDVGFTVYNLSQMDASRAANAATSRHTRVEAVKPCPFRKEGCCAPC